MKIIRHLSTEGPAFAALLPGGSYHAIAGDMLGDWLVTDRVIQPGKILAPWQPTNIICIGLNYAKHAAEGGKPPPERPIWFVKLPGSIQNPDDPICLPSHQPSTKVDYEAELAIVLGRTALNVARADAFDYILGYACANDVSARDWQRDFGGGQWNHAKSFDTFCPFGPAIVTKDEIPDPNKLRIRSVLNGTVMQDSSTADMVFGVPTLIEFLSADKTLPAGTVILTGTPEGVGFARKPPVWLKPGDIISVEIERIGTLTNPVRAGQP